VKLAVAAIALVLAVPAQAGAKSGRVLATGDSMIQIVDNFLAKQLRPEHFRVRSDAHVGTGISKPFLLDWVKHARYLARSYRPNATVVFLGANEGFPLRWQGKRHNCCSRAWRMAYSARAQAMMKSFERDGTARVYWLTLPTPRDPDRQKIARTVNAAIAVAAEPWRSQVRVFDTVPIFTPGARYRDAMPINGADKIVRESDGIHLNQTGSSYLADQLLPVIDRDFTR